MAFKGDLSALGQLQRNLGKLAAVPSRASRDASERIAELIAEEFDKAENPYGQGWAPLELSTVKRKGGDDEILVRTGDLRDTVDVHPMAGAGIAIELNDSAGYHQGGTVNMVARKILPDNSMPTEWNDAISEACEAAFRGAFE